MSFAHPSPPNIHMEGLVNLAWAERQQENLLDLQNLIASYCFCVAWLPVPHPSYNISNYLQLGNKSLRRTISAISFRRHVEVLSAWCLLSKKVTSKDLKNMFCQMDVSSWRCVWKPCVRKPVLCLLLFRLQQRLQLIREAFRNDTVLVQDQVPTSLQTLKWEVWPTAKPKKCINAKHLQRIKDKWYVLAKFEPLLQQTPGSKLHTWQRAAT